MIKTHFGCLKKVFTHRDKKIKVLDRSREGRRRQYRVRKERESDIEG
jgi:hypothetical protein